MVTAADSPTTSATLRKTSEFRTSVQKGWQRRLCCPTIGSSGGSPNDDPQVFGPPLPDVEAFPRTEVGLGPVGSSLYGPEVRRRSQLLGHRPDRAGFVEYDVGVDEQEHVRFAMIEHEVT
jgi:hypothetical protein